MGYSAINTRMAVPGSVKKKTAAAKEEEPLPFADGDGEEEPLLYGEDEPY